MFTIRYALAVSLLIPFISCIHAATENKMGTVQIADGKISGTAANGLSIFLGIPYAAPPAGGLRWKPPQEPEKWTGTRQATAFAPSCPQPGGNSPAEFSEDCLYLNVWTPAGKPDENLPVMVWIHGGGFNFGGSSLPEYDGARLAAKGVIVVTINYRLCPLGFLAHPLLSKESAHGVSGNYGLLDQIAALRWVKNNIAVFGGNPDQVTVFGQSAGSRSVSLLMISPLAKGLFNGAIAESGGPIIGSEYLNPNFNGDMAAIYDMGVKLADRMGCNSEKDILAAMRGKNAQDVLAAAASTTDIFAEDGLFFAPVFDGYVLPENPYLAYQNGRQHDVPLIAGSTLNEGNIYLRGQDSLTEDKYRGFIKSRFGENSSAAFRMFPVRSDKEVPAAIDKLITVGANAQPARFMAAAMGNSHSKGYLFQFTRKPGTEMAKKLGVHHGVELAYVFGNMTEEAGYDSTDFKLSEIMMGYWVNFARTGNPNGKGLPDWPEYRKKTDLNLEFSDRISVRKHLFKKECDFIEKYSQYGKH